MYLSLQNVFPDPEKSCGPYSPIGVKDKQSINPGQQVNTHVDETNHDTIGMIVIDDNGNIAGGTSTNGARNKVPG